MCELLVEQGVLLTEAGCFYVYMRSSGFPFSLRLPYYVLEVLWLQGVFASGAEGPGLKTACALDFL